MPEAFLPLDLSRYLNAGSANLKVGDGWLWPASSEGGEDCGLGWHAGRGMPVLGRSLFPGTG